MHKPTIMPSLNVIHYSLNTVRNMAITVQVKHLSRLRRSCDLLYSEEQGHRTEQRVYRHLVRLYSQ